MTEIEKIIDIILPYFLDFLIEKEKAEYMQKELDNKEFPSIHVSQEVKKDD